MNMNGMTFYRDNGGEIRVDINPARACYGLVMKTALIATVALFLMGCVTSRQSASLNPEQATTMALKLANDKAQAVYHCQPFHDGVHVCFIRDRWEWSAQTGMGTGDVEATVVLAEDGSTNQVSFQTLVNMNNISFLPNSFRRSTQGIP
jgi:hypothetical protein